MMLDLTPVLSVIMHLIPMLLVVVRFQSIAQIVTPSPSVPLEQAPSAAALAEQQERVVSVGITPQGFVVGGLGERGGLIACNAACALETYDYGGLRLALLEAQLLHPDEQRVVIAPAPTVSYEVLVRTMDTCRERIVGGERTPLFPQVVIATPPRKGGS
jgi:hypothetical protein